MTKTLKICTAMVLAIILILAYASFTSSASGEKMRYLDLYASKVHFVEDSPSFPTLEETGISNEHEADGVYRDVFEQVKEDMRRELAEYSDLNWDRFEEAGLVECEQKDDTIRGVYILSENKVFLVSEKVPKNLIDFKKLLAHELFHCLSIVREGSANPFNEGFTEYISQLIYPSSEDLIYFYNTEVARVLVEKYGIQGTIDLMHLDNDELYAKLSEDIGKPDSAKYLASAMDMFMSTDDQNAAILCELAAIDGICHLTINLGGSTNEAAALYAGMEKASPDLASAAKYFDSVLGR